MTADESPAVSPAVSPAPDSPDFTDSTGGLAPERVQAVIDAYVAGVAEGDAAKLAAMYAADGTIEDPVGSEVRRGTEAITKFYGVLADADISTELFTSRVCGNEAVFHFRVTSRYGDSEFVIEPIDHMVFNDDGTIRSMRAFWSLP